jgi:hypothetical protein
VRYLAAAGMLRIQSNLREEGRGLEEIGLNWIIGTATSKHLRQGSNSHGMLVMLAHNKSAGSAEDTKKRKGTEKGSRERNREGSRFDNRD